MHRRIRTMRAWCVLIMLIGLVGMMVPHASAQTSISVGATLSGNLPEETEACVSITGVGEPLCADAADFANGVVDWGQFLLEDGAYDITLEDAPAGTTLSGTTQYTVPDATTFQFQMHYTAPETPTGDVSINATLLGDGFPAEEVACVSITGGSEPLCAGASDFANGSKSWGPLTLDEGTYDVTPVSAPAGATLRGDQSFAIQANDATTASITWEYVAPSSSTVIVDEVTFLTSDENVADLPNGLTVTVTGDYTFGPERVIPPGATLPQTLTDIGLELPANASVTVTIGAFGFDMLVETFTVDRSAYTFTLSPTPPLPEGESSVTVTFGVEDPSQATELPAGTTWTLTQDGEEVYGGVFEEATLFEDARLELDPVPFGETYLTVDADGFAVYQLYAVLQKEEYTIDVRLYTDTYFAVEVTSLEPEITNVLPKGTVFRLVQDGTTVTSMTTLNDKELPTSWLLGSLPDENGPLQSIPIGAYTLEIISAGNVFLPYFADVTVGGPPGAFPVQLQPASLVDQIIAVLIGILEEILNKAGA